MATEQHEPSTGQQVRHRAVSAAALDSLRSIAVRLFALAGTAVLARLLTPSDFGVVAFGLTITTFGTFLVDGGVGTALIRRDHPPERQDLRALFGFQLLANIAFVVIVAAVALPFGEAGAIVTLMALALPISTVRTPVFVTYERRLDYRPLAMLDVVDTVTYYGCAIALVVGGWGVWGLAAASVVRAIATGGVALAFLPAARLLPGWDWSRVRVLLGFGVRYQSVGFVQMLRDQGVNACVALIGGTAMLGLWSVAQRILQIPFLLFNSLWRVSFPALSRLVSIGEDVTDSLDRAMSITAILTGLMLAPLAGSCALLVPVLLGERWADAAQAVPPACFGLMVGGPVSVALAGYLWAVGDAHVPLRATGVGIVIWAVVMLPLLPAIGIAAVGIGWMCSSIGEAFVLARGARRRIVVHAPRSLIKPVILATVSAVVSWGVAQTLQPTFPAAAATATLAGALYVVGLVLFQRSALRTTVRVARRGLSSAIARPT